MINVAEVGPTRYLRGGTDWILLLQRHLQKDTAIVSVTIGIFHGTGTLDEKVHGCASPFCRRLPPGIFAIVDCFHARLVRRFKWARW